MTTAVDSRQLLDFSEPLNQNALIHKATNECASFCIDNRLRQWPQGQSRTNFTQILYGQ